MNGVNERDLLDRVRQLEAERARLIGRVRQHEIARSILEAQVHELADQYAEHLVRGPQQSRIDELEVRAAGLEVQLFSLVRLVLSECARTGMYLDETIDRIDSGEFGPVPEELANPDLSAGAGEVR